MRAINAAAAFAILAQWTYLFVKVGSQAQWMVRWRFSPADQFISITLVALAFVGAVILLVDAATRPYRSNRPWALALAIVGVMSLGLASLAYYIGWGWTPRSFRFGERFCEECLATSEELPAPLDLTTVNLVHGGRLIGAANPCSACGSVVRTHAFYLAGLPVHSRGSFRVLWLGPDQLLARPTAFHWPHVALIAVLPTIVLGLATLIWLAG